jgi:hypothetical protein
MLATHETSGAKAVLMPERERKQQERPALGVGGNNDEGSKTLAFPDLALPGRKKIKPLVRRGEVLLIFEAAPDRLGLNKIVNSIDAGNAACFRPRWRIRRSAFDRGGQGHCKTCLQGIIYICGLADLCKERSTKSNDKPVAAGRK